MDHANSADALFPPDLLAEVEAVAAAQQRQASDVLREAVELYVRDHPKVRETKSKRTPREAAARMLEMRKGNPRLDDAAIHELKTYGRA